MAMGCTTASRCHTRPGSLCCRSQYDAALAEAHQTASQEAHHVLASVARSGHGALEAILSGLREAGVGHDASRSGALDRFRASGVTDVGASVTVMAEEEAQHVVVEVERRARELARQVAQARDRLAMREEQLVRAQGEAEQLRGELREMREAEAQRQAEAVKVST